jgi:hypothetical protein
MSTSAAHRTTPRRPLEFVAACPDHRGEAGLALAVTISTPERGMERKVWPHDGTIAGLAAAWTSAGRWLRAGGK